MKSSIVVALFAVCLVAQMAGATEIGPGPVFGDWDAAGNPYNINGEITVPAGETLTINHKVEVVFQGHYKLIINGYLEAVGTETSPILFTAANTVDGWNGIRIIDAPDTSHLTWCIIEYGRAFATSYLDPEGWGGGVLCYNSSPVISHCEFRENSATAGGAIVCYSSTSEITHCDLTGNYAQDLAGGAFFYLSDSKMRYCDISNNISNDSGGAVYVWDCSVTIDGCTISGNHCERWGGALGAGLPADITVRNCIITGNTSAIWAGGIAADTTTMTITNNVISGNSALGQFGGGVYAYRNCTGTISNNTIFGNEGNLHGGGIHFGLGGACSMELTNNILWNNSATGDGKEIWVGSTSLPSTLTIDYSDVDGGMSSVYLDPGCTLNWGDGMIDQDPLFFDPDEDDFHLRQDPCQPGIVNLCVDSGDPMSDLIVGTTRSDCHPDVGVIDMGYHYPLLGTVTADLACTPESGVLPFAVQFSVTMGNTADVNRRIAGRLEVTIASGTSYQNWRSGYTNVGPGESYAISWNKTVPALPSMVGPNVFGLHVEDVTPPPYNQPPYPPSGDTATADCTVTGVAQ